MSKTDSIPVVPDVDSIVAERYHLLDIISYEPQCTVFRARDTRRARFLDVAVYEDKHQQQHDARVAVLENLHHPGLCNLVDHGWDDRGPYLVYERPAGCSLREWLTQHGRLSVSQFASSLTQVLLAVSHIHASGLVHRAVSPDTVFVDGNVGRTSKVKLTAVHGCVRAGELAPPGTLSSQDSLAIRVCQFSPARVEPYDDVFALGILMRTSLDLDTGTDRFSYASHRSLDLLIDACLSPVLRVRPVDAGEVLERFLDYLPSTRRSPAALTLPRELAAPPSSLDEGAATQLLRSEAIPGPPRLRANAMQNVVAVALGAAAMCAFAFAPLSCSSNGRERSAYTGPAAGSPAATVPRAPSPNPSAAPAPSAATPPAVVATQPTATPVHAVAVAAPVTIPPMVTDDAHSAAAASSVPARPQAATVSATAMSMPMQSLPTDADVIALVERDPAEGSPIEQPTQAAVAEADSDAGTEELAVRDRRRRSKKRARAKRRRRARRRASKTPVAVETPALMDPGGSSKAVFMGVGQ